MGNSPQAGSAEKRELAADDPTMELDMLEQTASIEGAQVLRRDTYGLIPAPIPPDWILEGGPVARKRNLAVSSDQLAATLMWDCTAGRFNRFYDADEVIHVLEGSVLIEDVAGVCQRLRAGDTYLFPAGSRYHWTVNEYIRNISFLYPPLSREMRFVRAMVERLMAPFRRKPAGHTVRGA
ncbi:MAG TPA: cupin domain-containing protein [Steroidobacteraceae bacterium]|nr:cupin domain-containing protein [Steroidobacteraceae bacterium]